jgi:hypothetical protein
MNSPDKAPRPVDKASREEKESSEATDDLRPEWESEDRSEEGRKPDLEELDEDPSGFE